jgi:hypothetical protein
MSLRRAELFGTIMRLEGVEWDDDKNEANKRGFLFTGTLKDP